jgi:hypothetical protein
MTKKQQVFLVQNSVWADVEEETDEHFLAFDPVDQVSTYVDKQYECLIREVNYDS